MDIGFDLYQIYLEAREKFGRADHLLDFSLPRLCCEGSEEELNQALNAQLAVYTVSCIQAIILKSHNLLPDVVSGYSFGFKTSGIMGDETKATTTR
jgi:[acyl-carrier-protein] S-malonyltransferase